VSNSARSELITTRHLSRLALVDIRQSSPHQVLTNQESLRLQYALQQRAQELGWGPEQIELIDADLGMTAATATPRTGFQDLVAKGTRGDVGLILSVEVRRLARNCSDWYPLLDLCGFTGCLIADRDGIYDPATANGRLLLGLKGQISELELHTLKARLTAGLLQKAQRGELALQLPVGLIRDERGIVRKDPDREVQHRLALVFSTFLELRSASKATAVLNAQGLTLPRRDRFGEVVWRRPTCSAVVGILRNPAYAGAFVYGRHEAVRRDHTRRRPLQRLRPIAAWRIRLPDKYPAYIAWPMDERIQAMLDDNRSEYRRAGPRGVPREGSALLHGLVYCSESGHTLKVIYRPQPRYCCLELRHRYGGPVCQTIPATPVDARVVAAFFAVLAPAHLDLYERAIREHSAAIREHSAATEHRLRSQAQQLERLRYEAALAERRFRRVDPDHRLVAAELEQQWEQALRALKAAHETACAQEQEQQAELSVALARPHPALGPGRPGPPLAGHLGHGRALPHPEEGAAALPHRQSRHPPPGPGSHPHPHRLARGRHDQLRHPHRRRRSTATDVCPGAGRTGVGGACGGKERRRDSPALDRTRVSLTPPRHRAAEHGPSDSTPAADLLGASEGASSSPSGVPGHLTGGRAVGCLTAMALLPHPRRADRPGARRGHRALSLSGSSRHVGATTAAEDGLVQSRPSG
jgi:DNA invertase Pin-like site-specific DNA recombinase